MPQIKKIMNLVLPYAIESKYREFAEKANGDLKSTRRFYFTGGDIVEYIRRTFDGTHPIYFSEAQRKATDDLSMNPKELSQIGELANSEHLLGHVSKIIREHVNNRRRLVEKFYTLDPGVNGVLAKRRLRIDDLDKYLYATDRPEKPRAA